VQGYGWLKERILGEEGRRQQMQLRELGLIAEQLGCSLAQLAIGHSITSYSSRLVFLHFMSDCPPAIGSRHWCPQISQCLQYYCPW